LLPKTPKPHTDIINKMYTQGTGINGLDKPES